MSQGTVDPKDTTTKTPQWLQILVLVLTAALGVLGGRETKPTPTPDDNKKQVAPVPDGGKTTPAPVPPAPAPPPQPSPQPQPLPQPSPSQVINISVTDSLGNQIHGGVDAGKIFAVSVTPEFQLLGIPQPSISSGEVIQTAPNRLICTLQAGAKLQVVAYGGTGKPTIAMVICNQAPQPPPGPQPQPLPNPPGPTPNPNPQPLPSPTPPIPVTNKVKISVVEDSKNRSPETASILNQFDIWEKIKSSGNDWRLYDGNADNPDPDPQAQTAIKALQSAGVPVPGVVVTDLQSGNLVGTPKPLTRDNFTSLTKQLGI